MLNFYNILKMSVLRVLEASVFSMDQEEVGLGRRVGTSPGDSVKETL